MEVKDTGSGRVVASGRPIKLFVWGEPEVVTQYVRVPKYVATVTRYVTAVTTKVVTVPASYVSRLMREWEAVEDKYKQEEYVSKLVDRWSAVEDKYVESEVSSGKWGELQAYLKALINGLVVPDSVKSDLLSSVVPAVEADVKGDDSKLKALLKRIQSLARVGGAGGELVSMVLPNGMSIQVPSWLQLRVSETLAKEGYSHPERPEGDLSGAQHEETIRSEAQTRYGGVHRGYSIDEVKKWLLADLARLQVLAPFISEDEYNGLKNSLTKLYNEINYLGARLRNKNISDDDAVKLALDLTAAQELHSQFMKWWGEAQSRIMQSVMAQYAPSAPLPLPNISERYVDPKTLEKLSELIKKINDGEITDPSQVLGQIKLTPGTHVIWGTQKVLEWVFPTAKLGQFLAGKAKELAAQASDPLLKQFYDAVSYAFMTGGIAATGPYASMLSSAVPGAGPALIIAGLTQFANEISRYRNDPIYREQLQDFLNRVKSGDKDAIATLASMIIGTALAGYLAAKTPKIKVGGVELGARIRSSIGSKLRGLAERLRSMGYKDLAEKFEALAKKYSSAGVFRGSVTENPSSQRWEVKYDPKRGVLEIVYLESGKVEAAGKVTEVDIPENVLRSVATKYGYSIDDVADALRKYLSMYVKGENLDDVVAFLKGELSKGNVELAGRVINEMVKAVKSSGKSGVFITQDKVVFLDTHAERDMGNLIRLEVVDARNSATKVLVYFSKKYGTPVGAVVVKDGKVLTGDTALEVLRTVFNRGSVYEVLEKAIPDWPRLWASIQSNPDILSSVQTEVFRFEGGDYGSLTVATPKGVVKFSKVYGPTLVIDGKEIPLKGIITEFKKYSFDKLRSGVNVGDYRLQVVAKIKLPPPVVQRVQAVLGKVLSDAVKGFKNGMSKEEVTQVVTQELREVTGNATDAGQLMQLAQFLVRTAERAASGGGSEITLPIITSNGSEASVLFASVMASTSAKSAQQQARQVNTAVTAIEKLKASGATQVSVSDIAKILGVSLTEAQALLPQIINQLGLKTVEVQVEVPVPQEVVKEVPKVVEVEQLVGLSTVQALKPVYVTVEIPKPEEVIKDVTVPVTVEVPVTATINKPLKVVQVVKEIPVPKTVVKEIPVVTEREELIGLETTGNVVEVVVPKTITVEVPYYEVVDIPINIKDSTPPEPTPPTPVPPIPVPPPGMPLGVSYGGLPPGAFRPPKRRKQEEEVVI